MNCSSASKRYIQSELDCQSYIGGDRVEEGSSIHCLSTVNYIVCHYMYIEVSMLLWCALWIVWKESLSAAASCVSL